MTQEEMEELERARTEVEEMVSSEQWAEEVAREMEYEVRGEEDSERTAQAAAGPSTCAYESKTTESQESEEESMRTDQQSLTDRLRTTIKDSLAIVGSTNDSRRSCHTFGYRPKFSVAWEPLAVGDRASVA